MSDAVRVPRFRLNVIDRERNVGQVREFGPLDAERDEVIEVLFPWSEDDGTVTPLKFSYEAGLGFLDGDTAEVVEDKP